MDMMFLLPDECDFKRGWREEVSENFGDCPASGELRIRRPVSDFTCTNFTRATGTLHNIILIIAT